MSTDPNGFAAAPGEYFEGNFTVHFPLGEIVENIALGQVAAAQVGVFDLTGIPDGLEYEFYLDNGTQVDTIGLGDPEAWFPDSVGVRYQIPVQTGYLRFCIRIFGTPIAVTSSVDDINVRFAVYGVDPFPWVFHDYTIPYIISENLYTPEICFVNTDLESGVNRIVWNKVESNFVDSFRVYYSTESSPQQQNFLGSVAYENLSEFYDSTNTNPNEAINYYLSMVNNDAVESDKSQMHTTIHLNVDTFTNVDGQQVGLSWNNYEPLPPIEEDYLIFSGSSPSNLTVEAAIPAGFNTWMLPFTNTLTYYAVGTTLDAYCVPSKTSNGEEVFSNVVSNANYLGVADQEKIAFSLYPNPAIGIISVHLPEMSQNAVISLFNVHGQMIQVMAMSGQFLNIDLTSIDQGVYFLCISDGDRQGWKKFIRQSDTPFSPH
ncbi:MAG: T9SS type A sorting domain-containing protein [Flavobacteriales bacterium]|nr:T9SS type A sorting domain-containing protein [Flavobacteriales bacterium]